MIPNERSCTPPRKRMIMMRVGNPCTGSPNMMVFINIYIIYKKAEHDAIIPNSVDILSGAMVYDVIPSIAKLNNL